MSSAVFWMLAWAEFKVSTLICRPPSPLPTPHPYPYVYVSVSRTHRAAAPSLVSRGIHVSESGLLVKRAGPAAVAAENDAVGDAGADED